MSNTVSLCMIVKNEISNIEYLMNDVCPVLEQVVVVDTGSTDGTYEKLKNLENKYQSLEVHTYKWHDHFSDARNFSFSLANNDWIFWLDGDDRIDRSKLKYFKDNILDNSDVDVWMLDYNYAQLPSGEPQIVLGRERFLRRSLNSKWQGAIHETIYVGGYRTRHHYGLEVVHNRNGKVIEHGRNLRILEQEYEKNPNDPRTAYYYGKELFDHVNPKGIEVLEKYLDIQYKYWDDEVNARFRLGKHYLVNGEFTKAVNQAERIYHLDSSRMRSEAYWLWGAVEKELKNYKAAIRWFKWCLDEPPGPPRVLNKEYYSWNPRMRLVECYLNIDQPEEALKYYLELEKMLPNDPMVKSLEKQLEEKLRIGPKGSLLVLEFGGKVREDSYSVGEEISRLRVNLVRKVDGIVYHKENFDVEDLDCISKIKEGGFLWVNNHKVMDNHGFIQKLGLNLLCVTTYRDNEFTCYIKESQIKPKIQFECGNQNFGPFRIRITTLEKSAIKNAYRVRRGGERVDYFVGSNLSGHEDADIKILDICEWIESGYANRGIEYADAVCVCSEELAQLIKEHDFHNNIFVLEDRFEFTEREWL